jgi:DNA-binding YbaB/EbfC family protein
MKDMQEILRQAQQMQERLARIQEELAGRTVEASAGGGMVTVVVNGRQEVVSVRIEKEFPRMTWSCSRTSSRVR